MTDLGGPVMNRTAATLMEALVAIFIMAVGLLTLLTLFPLGALSMAQAVQDNRAAHAAANAMALAAVRNLRNDPVVTGAPRDYFQRPGKWAHPAPSHRRSYPIYVDGFGASVGSKTVADVIPGIRRQSVSWVVNQPPELQFQYIMKNFTLQDDMRFITHGAAQGLPTHNPDWEMVDRYGRYSWAYLLHRPKTGDPTVVDVTVVVYSGRLWQLPLQEVPYSPVTFDPATNSVRVTWDPATQTKPSVRKGAWVLDATMPSRGDDFEPHGYFYRVVGVSDVGANTVVMELETKPKRYTSQGVLIVMENVIEVFEKGAGWQP